MSFITKSSIPKGKGIFAFSDQAGANACMALAFILMEETKEQPFLVTNQNRHTNNAFGLKVHFTEELPDLSYIKPAYIFTGTSHPDSSKEFEIKMVLAAKQHSVYSISFIDHWVNFRIRFLINNQFLIEPDEIWVINNEARKLAIAEGLDEKKIIVHGNPYHYFLSNDWKSQYRGKAYLEEKLDIQLNHTFIILYAPDPVSLRNQHSHLSFDEGSVLELLLKVISKIKEPDILLIIKPHPLQDPGVLKEKLKHSPVRSIFLSDINNHELINASDLIIGYYSNFLIEAACLKKPVIRFFPDPPDQDPLRFAHTGKIVRTEKELSESIINNMK